MKNKSSFNHYSLQNYSSESGNIAGLAIILILALSLIVYMIQSASNSSDHIVSQVNATVISVEEMVSKSSLLTTDEALNQPALVPGWEVQLQNMACFSSQASASGQLTGPSAVQVTFGAYFVDSAGTAAPYSANYCHTCGGPSSACVALGLQAEAQRAAQRSGGVDVPTPFLGFAAEKSGKLATAGTVVRAVVAAAVPPSPAPAPAPAPGPIVPIPTPTATPTASPTATATPTTSGPVVTVPDVVHEFEHGASSGSDPTSLDPSTTSGGEPSGHASGHSDAHSFEP